jgi:serine phosphatase RsbU (regulator of sigma subunit)
VFRFYYFCLTALIKQAIMQKLFYFFIFLWLHLFYLPHQAHSQTEEYANGKKLTLTDYLGLAAQKEKEGLPRDASHFLNQAATIHWEKKEYDKAIEYFEKSLELNESIGNEQGISGISSNLGMIYTDKQQYDKAANYFDKVIAFRKKGKDKGSLVACYINASVVLNNLKDHNKAANYLEEALRLSKESNNAEQMKSCYGMLSETYEKAGIADKAKENFDMYRTFHEMIQRDKEITYKQSAEEARLRIMLVEAEKKNKELALHAANSEIKEQAKALTASDSTNNALTASMTKQELTLFAMRKEARVKELELEQQEELLQRGRLIRYGLLGILGLLSAFAFFIYRSYREKKQTNWKLKRQNQEISEQQSIIIVQKNDIEKALAEIADKNHNIIASINYAQRIQAAVLRDKSTLKQLLPDSFILFRPRDVVSGDFYWFQDYKNQQTGENLLLLAAVDCTGHGVPGAFMSMIGANLLNQIVSNNIVSPEKVLEAMHQGISTSLRQKDTENQDGMDMVFCTLNTTTKKMETAGAKNQMYYIQQNELVEIKGDKQAIGGKTNANAAELAGCFTKTTVDISLPTTIYLFTDGYQDQFGGKESKKFMTRNMKNLFLEIYKQPADEQLKIVEKTIVDWIGKNHQIDDILVMGANIN